MPSHNCTDARIVAALLVCGLSLGLASCDKKVKAAPPVATSPAPVIKQTQPSTEPEPTPPTENAAPPATNPPPTDPVLPPAPHKQPKKSATESADQPAETSRPPAPQISPQLSPGDQASYERKTNDDISVAEKNLQQASGRQLNAAQQDLAEKIRSFLAQSHEATKGNDWTRAQNLAQKARLLSIELVNSL
jgi:type IV secretory pathway VirB10-like protein